MNEKAQVKLKQREDWLKSYAINSDVERLKNLVVEQQNRIEILAMQMMEMANGIDAVVKVLQEKNIANMEEFKEKKKEIDKKQNELIKEEMQKKAAAKEGKNDGEQNKTDEKKEETPGHEGG